MFANTEAFSGFAVDDIDAAREFYGETLGLQTSTEHGLMTLHLAGGRPTLVYPKPEPHAGRLHDPQLQGRRRSRRRRRARRTRRGARALRRHGAGRARHHARRRPVHRLVQGPRRQRARGAAGPIGRDGRGGRQPKRLKWLSPPAARRSAETARRRAAARSRARRAPSVSSRRPWRCTFSASQSWIGATSPRRRSSSRGPMLGLDRLPQLRGDQAAERVAREVAEAAGAPVHVLQAAERVRADLDAEQAPHPVAPRARQVGDGERRPRSARARARSAG